jgi:hypothetical protein
VDEISAKKSENFFFVGQTVTHSEKDKVALEKRRFRDIIEIKVEDEYSLSSRKMIEMLKYTSKNFGGSNAVLKLDDDTLPNIMEIIASLRTLPACKFWWWGHVLSMSAVKAIAEKHLELTHEIWMEDVSIARWFDEVLAEIPTHDVCRFHDLGWLGKATNNCSHKYLIFNEMMPFEQSNKGKKQSEVSKHPYMYIQSWKALQNCSQLCTCTNTLGRDSIFIFHGTSETQDITELKQISSARITRLQLQLEKYRHKNTHPIGYAIVTGCKRWPLVEKNVPILKNEHLHIFGNCVNATEFERCFALRHQLLRTKKPNDFHLL